jgi:hypothetical protein
VAVGTVWNPEEGEHPPLEDITRGLGMTQMTERTKCMLK